MLRILIKDRGLRPPGSDVDHALVLGCQRREPVGTDGIGRVQDDDTGLRRHHREILETHLRRPILAD